MPAWHEIQVLIAGELGEPVHDARPLTPPRTSRMTWAARAPGTGAIVIKARHGDNAFEKAQWSAERLPALGARGYPVPTILWHGMISAELHVAVQNRLPGRLFRFFFSDRFRFDSFLHARRISGGQANHA